MYKIINSNSLKDFNTWSASFHCLFEEEKQKVLSTPKDELIDFINNKTRLLSEIGIKFYKKTEYFYGTYYKNISNDLRNSLSVTDLNITMDIISCAKKIEELTESTLFNKVASFILFIIKNFNQEDELDKKIKELEEKINFLKSLKD